MRHNLIKTEDYLLVVNDEIPTDWYYDNFINKIKRTGGAEYGESVITKKIIAHLPLNNAPYLEGVDLLPPLEDDVEKLAKETFPPQLPNQKLELSWDGFIKGYNKAKEIYKYTEEDLRKAYMKGKHGGVTEVHYEFNEIIQSLNQPKLPVAFECEMFETQVRDINTHELIKGRRKTITNSEGRTEWVGKWMVTSWNM